MTKPPRDEDLYVYLASVERVIDGDTVILSIDLGLDVWMRGQHCRLLGINAPEKTGGTREEGLAAKEHLEKLLQGYEHILVRTHYDKHCTFGRLLVELYATDDCINDEMVEDGFAVAI
jgi:micrococcal nuclease